MDRSEHTANTALAEQARMDKHNRDTMRAWIEVNKRAAQLRAEREANKTKSPWWEGWFAW